MAGRKASLMAARNSVSLAIPVLANIYHGLNNITISSKPGSSNACFPMHYVYGWLGYYFGTHFINPFDIRIPLMARYSGEGGAMFFDGSSARNRIYNGVAWKASLISPNREVEIIDNKLNTTDFSYLVSTRSSFLPIRHGKSMAAEPYSPRRFGRQFGFCQDRPGTLKEKIHPKSVNDLLRLWKIAYASILRPN